MRASRRLHLATRNCDKLLGAYAAPSSRLDLSKALSPNPQRIRPRRNLNALQMPKHLGASRRQLAKRVWACGLRAIVQWSPLDEECRSECAHRIHWRPAEDP